MKPNEFLNIRGCQNASPISEGWVRLDEGNGHLRDTAMLPPRTSFELGIDTSVPRAVIGTICILPQLSVFRAGLDDAAQLGYGILIRSSCAVASRKFLSTPGQHAKAVLSTLGSAETQRNTTKAGEIGFHINALTRKPLIRIAFAP